jgi:hypothetical protein
MSPVNLPRDDRALRGCYGVAESATKQATRSPARNPGKGYLPETRSARSTPAVAAY